MVNDNEYLYSTATKRGRGRPRKPKKLIFTTDVDLETFNVLSADIARLLSTQRGTLTDKLAHAGKHYLNTAQIRREAPLRIKKRGGNRENIHLAILLRDCALALQPVKEEEIDARKLLSAVGKWTEGNSQVIACARAVLGALGINHPFSLRQQAKQAIRYL